MEDPESEWEIQEYPSSKDGETSMTRWILNKGYGIGKKVVITGIAISSAPLVLPPLIVFSAMGVAFSVPFGIVFVSYACTNKIMSKLLPMPPPSSSMLEYYADEDEQETKDGWEEDEYRIDNVIKQAEEEQAEDIKRGVVCRFDLDEGGDGIMYDEGYFIHNGENREGDDEARPENVLQEVEDVQMEDINREGYDDSQEVEAVIMNADEEGFFINEGENDVLGQENLLQEVEEERMENSKQGPEISLDVGVGSHETAEALITNANGTAEEGGYNMDNLQQEEEDDKGPEHYLGPEIVSESMLGMKQMEDMGQGDEIGSESKEGCYDSSQEVEVLITDADVIIDQGYGINDLKQEQGEDDLGPEIVLQEDEVEQIDDIQEGVEIGFELDEGRDNDNYTQEAEASVTNPDGILDEQGYYADEKVKEGKHGVLAPENVSQDEDLKQEAGLDVGGDDVMSLISNLDHEAHRINTNRNEKEQEHGLLERENAIKEEKREMGDIEHETETRLQLDATDDNQRQTDDGSNTISDGAVDEEGYEEDSGEYVESVSLDEDMKQEAGLDVGGDDFRPLISNVDQEAHYIDKNRKEMEQERSLLQRENAVKEEEKKQMEDIKQEIQMRLQLDATDDDQRRTDEGSNTISGTGVDEEGYEEDTGEYIEGDDGSLEEERTGEEPVLERHQVVIVVEENVETNVVDDEEDDIVKGSTGLLQKIRDEGKVDDNRFEDDNIHVESRSNDVKDVDKKEPVMDEPLNYENLVEGGSNNQDAIMRMKKEDMTRSNEDAREIADESGLDLYDDRNEATYKNIESLEDRDWKNVVPDDTVDVVALPDFRKAPLETPHVKVASRTDTKVPYREGSLDEEKIWEQIGAMRAIVGYQAPSEATCMEELKALYVFTGVEPPASTKGDSDLDEVNAKLKFLMSIIGVR